MKAKFYPRLMKREELEMTPEREKLLKFCITPTEQELWAEIDKLRGQVSESRAENVKLKEAFNRYLESEVQLKAALINN